MTSGEAEAEQATDLPKVGGQVHGRAILGQGTFCRAGWWPRQSQCSGVHACGFQPISLHGKEQCLWAGMRVRGVGV